MDYGPICGLVLRRTTSPPPKLDVYNAGGFYFIIIFWICFRHDCILGSAGFWIRGKWRNPPNLDVDSNRHPFPTISYVINYTSANNKTHLGKPTADFPVAPPWQISWWDKYQQRADVWWHCRWRQEYSDDPAVRKQCSRQITHDRKMSWLELIYGTIAYNYSIRGDLTKQKTQEGILRYGMWRQLARHGAQCGTIFTIQFIGESNLETPKIAEPYFRSWI